MIDIETRLRDHFNERTSDLPATGPGLDSVARAPRPAPSAFGVRSAALVAASLLVVVAVGALVVIGNSGSDSVSSPGHSGPVDSEPTVSEPAVLQPVETLPSTPDVSESPVTVASAAPVDWYRFAPDLDIAWYLDPQSQADISMFCWRTTAVAEPQCFVDPLGATIVPLVVPVAGGQTVVLAGGDRTNPVLTVTLDDGTQLEARQDFDETIDWGTARFELPAERVVASVGGLPVQAPQTLDDYIPPILLDLIGLDLGDFEEQAAAFGFETRVVEADGEGLDVTFDIKGNRINVATTDGVVTAVLPVG